MSLYKSMKPFRYNLDLVIKNMFFSLHDSFPGIEYISDKQVFSGMSKYNYSHNYISIVLIGYLFIEKNQ